MDGCCLVFINRPVFFLTGVAYIPPFDHPFIWWGSLSISYYIIVLYLSWSSISACWKMEPRFTFERLLVDISPHSSIITFQGGPWVSDNWSPVWPPGSDPWLGGAVCRGWGSHVWGCSGYGTNRMGESAHPGDGDRRSWLLQCCCQSWESCHSTRHHQVSPASFNVYRGCYTPKSPFSLISSWFLAWPNVWVR